ncbi:DUF4387 family protein [Streptomyces fagopyri]|uniref:DUF4387 family protein n=1 Tax=Streptomyces fagopyri TaxID=2662397 RepID=A0A5Q0L5I7_9ACTN|nr:DUF4387 domain-containing protein [Streptomyces fagopyri]QFZ71949.1 DUF4387 family protein [Streptomyces fagopyri]
MPEHPTPAPQLSDYAIEIRSKNAGPFWVTMETFMKDSAGYAIAADDSFLNEQVIADLYRVDATQVQIFRIPALNAVKISFPRPVTQASLRDRDIHAGQHHVPLACLRVPHHPLTDEAQPVS